MVFRQFNSITTSFSGQVTADTVVYTYPIQEDSTILAEVRGTFVDYFNFPPLGSAAFIHIFSAKRLNAGAAAVITGGSVSLYSAIDTAITGSPNPSINWALSGNNLVLHIKPSSTAPTGDYLAEIKLLIT